MNMKYMFYVDFDERRDWLKKCKACGIEKELSEFYGQQKYSKKMGNYIYYPPECKKCTSIRTYKYELENPDVAKKSRKNTYKREARKRVLYENQKTRSENGKYREWQQNNPDKTKQYGERHRKHDISKEQWLICKDYFKNIEGEWCCAYCGLLHKDHLARRLGKVFLMDLHKEHAEHDGANDISNCIPSCQRCNSRKRKKSLMDWFPKQKFFSEIRLNKINQWLVNDHKIMT